MKRLTNNARMRNAVIISLLSCSVVAASAAARTADDPQKCSLQKSSCAGETLTGLTVRFDIQPKPITVLNDLTFSASIKQAGAPVKDAEVTLDLGMPGMSMGRNRTTLKHSANGRYDGRGIIPRCMSGGKAWQATVFIRRGNDLSSVHYLFEVR